MINKEDAAQMVDLMFDADRLDTQARLFVEFPAFILPAKAYPAMSHQKCGIVRKTHAAFLSGLGFSLFQDHGIHKNEAFGFRITLRHIHDRDGFGNADLWCCNADTMGLAFHNTNQGSNKS